MSTTLAILSLLLMEPMSPAGPARPQCPTGEECSVHMGGEDKIDLRIEGGFVVVTTKGLTEADGGTFEFRVPMPPALASSADANRR